MLSHELRNPLAAITNAVKLLILQKHEEPLQLQARTIIQRQMGQLIRLVDDLMEVSRITSGRIHLQKERTGLNGIVERAVETTRSLMDQHRHELTVSLNRWPQRVRQFMNQTDGFMPEPQAVPITNRPRHGVRVGSTDQRGGRADDGIDRTWT